MYQIRRIVWVLLALLGAGCSQEFLGPQGAPAAPVADTQLGVEGRASGHLLYVGDLFDRISQYSLGKSKPIRSVEAASEAAVLAMDVFGNLFAANAQVDYGEIDVYTANKLGLLRRIQNLSDPMALATDRDGYLYVANTSVISIYAPGGTKMVGTIRGGNGPDALAFDGAGKLYIANGNGRSVGVYRPAKTPSRVKFLRDITDAVKFPFALTIRASQLFVANWGRSYFSKPGNRRDSVSEYALKSLSAVRVIEDGIERPFALAVDSNGYLYVANNPLRGGRHSSLGWVAVYAPGTTQPSREITAGIDHPVSLAVDPSDDLYVANDHTVTVYGSAGAKFLHTIGRGVHAPSSVMVALP